MSFEDEESNKEKGAVVVNSASAAFEYAVAGWYKFSGSSQVEGGF